MTRGYFFAIAMVIAVVTFALLPLTPTPPALSITTAPAGQEEYLRQLQLADGAERKGLLAEAQKAYSEAALAIDPAIADAGNTGFLRVAELQASHLYRIQRALRDPLVLITLLLAVVGVVYLSVSRKPCYIIPPFEDFSQDGRGKALHLLVARHIESGRAAYRRANQERLQMTPYGPDPAQPSNDSISMLLTMLGDPNIGPVTVPLSKSKDLLEIWRSRNDYRLTGQFYHFQDKNYVDAAVMRGQRQEEHWRLQSEAGAIDPFIEELAYRFLARALGKENPFQHWETLAAWTESLKAAQNLPVREDQLQVLIERLTRAESAESGLLARRIIAFQIGEMYQALARYDDARGAYQRAIQAGPGDDLDMLALLRMTETVYLDFEPKKFDEARQSFQQITLQNNEKNETVRQKQIMARSNAAQALIWAHWLHDDSKNSNKREHVRECAGKALKLDGDAADVRAAVHIALGLQQENQKNLDAALLEYSRALEANRNFPSAATRKAVALIKKAGLDSRATEDMPGKAVIAAYERKDQAKTEHLLSELQPLAREAESLLMEAIRLRHGEVYARKQLCSLLLALGRVYDKTGRLFDDGIAAYRRAVEVDPKHFDAWDNLSYRIDESGTEDLNYLLEAKAAAEHADQIAPDEKRKTKVRELLERILTKIEQIGKKSRTFQHTKASETNP